MANMSPDQNPTSSAPTTTDPQSTSSNQPKLDTPSSNAIKADEAPEQTSSAIDESKAATAAPNTKIGSFEPKYKVTINEPRDDEYTLEQLAKYDGTGEDKAAWVAIKGVIFDVSGKDVYAPGGSYAAFAGHDASRALAQSSLDKNEVRAEYDDLTDEQKKVLEQWFTFFSKRYSIMGKVVQAP